MRRRRVVAGEAERVERAQLAGEEAPAGLGVAGVEAALEAELERDAGRPDRRGDVERRGEVVGERLLAERRQAPADRLPDQRRVGVRGGGDDDGIGFVERGLDRCGGADAGLGGDGRGPVGDRVGDDDLVDARRRGEQPGVEATDPARAELGDLHRARASTSAARPIRSDSAGASHVLSCSTISQPP